MHFLGTKHKCRTKTEYAIKTVGYFFNNTNCMAQSHIISL